MKLTNEQCEELQRLMSQRHGEDRVFEKVVRFIEALPVVPKADVAKEIATGLAQMLDELPKSAYELLLLLSRQSGVVWLNLIRSNVAR
ncbi:MAG: hypothetical protein JWQ87_3926 [Candidatus Sulfotelmatobacter sp.]|nr:hypothetical protein [Candidatus Sulfotelmatobacter sp.]